MIIRLRPPEDLDMLCGVIKDAYPSSQELTLLVQRKLGIDLPGELSEYPVRIFKLIVQTNAEGKLAALVEAVIEDRPHRPDLQETLGGWLRRKTGEGAGPEPVVPPEAERDNSGDRNNGSAHSRIESPRTQWSWSWIGAGVCLFVAVVTLIVQCANNDELHKANTKLKKDCGECAAKVDELQKRPTAPARPVDLSQLTLPFKIVGDGPGVRADEWVATSGLVVKFGDSSRDKAMPKVVLRDLTGTPSSNVTVYLESSRADDLPVLEGRVVVVVGQVQANPEGNGIAIRHATVELVDDTGR